jgi:hypothetical protein
MVIMKRSNTAGSGQHLASIVVLAASTAAGPASAQTSTQGAPRVHFDADAPEMTLMTLGSALESDRPLCRAPCDRVVNGREGQVFYFGGEGVVPSTRFKVLDWSDDVRLEVRAGRGGSSEGIPLLVLGSLATLGGLILVVVSQPPIASESNSKLLGVGAGVGLGGLAMSVGGAVLIGLSRPTRYTFVGLRPAPGGVALVF